MTAAERAPMLTRAGFAAWLDAQPDDAVVGESQSCGRCPLAIFARDGLGIASALIGTSSWSDHAGIYVHAPWAAAFVFAVDDLGREVRITAATARALLAAVAS